MRAKASTVLLVAAIEITAFLLSSQLVFQASGLNRRGWQKRVGKTERKKFTKKWPLTCDADIQARSKLGFVSSNEVDDGRLGHHRLEAAGHTHPLMLCLIQSKKK